MSREDSAFYTNSAGSEVVWEDKANPRFYVIRNGEMRIHYSRDLESHTVIRYTDQLEEIGVKTDADLEKFTALGDEMFSWVNNSWFEVLDSNDSEYYSEPYHELKDAVEQTKVLQAEYGNDKEIV